jgi:predicted AAA+ superfamily ATPase
MYCFDVEELEIVRESYLKELERWRGAPVVKVLSGMRRTGKSVLLRQWKDRLDRDHGTPGLSLRLIERDSLEWLHLETWEALRDELTPWVDGVPGSKVLLIDEVQLIEGWEKVVNALHKRGDVDIYLTGSNARLLSSDLSTLLSGRWVGIRVLPLSYGETLAIRGKADHEPEEFDRWLRWGGLPGLHRMPDDRRVLEQTLDSIYATVILHDVVRRHEVRNVPLLERVARFLFDQVGNLVNAKRIADYCKSQRISVGVETIQSYASHLEGAFAVHKVKRWDLKGKRHLEVAEKWYAGDLGIRNALLGRDAMADVGALLENAVFLELLRRGYTVSVGKLGDREIDFVAERAGAREYFQVCYLMADPATAAREFRSLLDVDDNLPKTVLSMDPLDLSRDGIRHAFLPRWFLEEGAR